MSEQSPHLQNNNNVLNTAKEKTRKQAKTLWQIMKKYNRVSRQAQERSTKEPMVPPQQQKPYSSTLKLLSVFPYLLVTSFFISFFWDFDGLSFSLFDYPIQLEGLLKIISVSGLIGFLTNWVASTMLFKPVQKRPLLGHGLIPAQKNRIAYRLAKAVSEDLINPEIIKEKISTSDIISKYREDSTRYIRSIIDNPHFREDLKQWVLTYLDEMVANLEIREALAKRILKQIEEAVQQKSLERIALRAYSYVKGQEMQHIIEESLAEIPNSVEAGLDQIDRFLDDLPQQIEDNSEQIESIVTTLLYKLVNQLDVHHLVEENLQSYDEQHLSSMLRNATNEQLHYIQYLGAVLGCIGGFIIWEPLPSLFLLGTLFLFLLGLDALLLNYFSDLNI